MLKDDEFFQVPAEPGETFKIPDRPSTEADAAQYLFVTCGFSSQWVITESGAKGWGLEAHASAERLAKTSGFESGGIPVLRFAHAARGCSTPGRPISEATAAQILFLQYGYSARWLIHSTVMSSPIGINGALKRERERKVGYALTTQLEQAKALGKTRVFNPCQPVERATIDKLIAAAGVLEPAPSVESLQAEISRLRAEVLVWRSRNNKNRIQAKKLLAAIKRMKDRG